jgi:transcription-repair coupling factor (superfamily II helicase)
MLDEVKQIISSNERVKQALDALKTVSPGDQLSIHGSSGSFFSLLLVAIKDQIPRQLLVVARDKGAAETLSDDLRLLLGNMSVKILGGHGVSDGVFHDEHRKVEDIEALRGLVTDSVSVLVTHPEALSSKLPEPDSVRGKVLTIRSGEQRSFSATVEHLTRFSFERTDFVKVAGDYSVRGGILDVYPFVGNNPIRVEFLGDNVESIREFDLLSQRSIKGLLEAIIVPDLLPGKENGIAVNSSLMDYMRSDVLLVLDEPELIQSRVEKQTAATVEKHLAWDELEQRLRLFPSLNIYSVNIPLSGAIDLGSIPQAPFNGSIRLLKRSLLDLQDRTFRIFVTCDSQSELRRLKDLLAEAESSFIPKEKQSEAVDGEALLDVARITFSLHSLHAGFALPESRLALVTEHQIFNRIKRMDKKRRARSAGISSRDLQQLRKGDYVVHDDYGIGRYDGLRRIRVSEIDQEVVKVLYEENDTLYVNLNYVNKIQKYSSKEGHIPKLTRLGGTDWDKIKSRAKRRIKDIARDLIQLYAARKHSRGFAFEADATWQKELEASFMYEDTFDQAKATHEVKQDMEATHPMDRLVCGDVGFGKTEVAIRAAFKAVLGGKQVAVLVPTTILALQHYSTFTDRLSRYVVNVEVISRFKSRRDQTAIAEQLRAGTIDIIIGTHRLLSNDISFNDLGLLIIDEEHRFGVSAKERLRHLRADVDTLSLTATPIPRTLHFSLLGARDLSIIATPPRNRLPVITEFTRYDADSIKDAVQREQSRGGQVYFVHDKIEGIEEVAERLRSVLPGVRIAFAHGQMYTHKLEMVMRDFLEKKVDVLVCTKIIESGLDIPNVNTIFINRADGFGMAELYQLRGRVGRSNVQAYAYLLTPHISVLSKVTIQRLQAIQEFTELGSGLNLAMRDLEIRGAGNLLGREQSGFIETMGFETYARILDEAVHELKDLEFQGLFKDQSKSIRKADDTLVQAELDALIPQTYVQSDLERFEIYRRLYSVATVEQLEEVALELKDRFGTHPSEVENLFAVIKIRLAAARLGFKKVNVSDGKMEIEFPPEIQKHFYDRKEVQHIMEHKAHEQSVEVSLKRVGKTLSLSASFFGNCDNRDVLENSLEFLYTTIRKLEKLKPEPVLTR